MDLVLLFLGVLVLLALPVGIYWLRVKPGVTGEARGMVIVARVWLPLCWSPWWGCLRCSWAWCGRSL